MVLSAVEEWAAQFPDAPAAIDSEATITWSALVRRVQQLERELVRLEVGARVVLHVPQRADSIALLLACSSRGIDAILVSELYPRSRAERAVEDTRAVGILRFKGGALELERLRDRELRALESAPIVGVLTSGSTGRPKCAEHTWLSLVAAVKKSARRAEKRWILAYPISHIAALQVIVQCLLNRGVLIIPAAISPEEVARAMRSHNAQCISATPTFFRYLIHSTGGAGWSDVALEQVLLGGELVDQRILNAIREVQPRARITHIYATTELGPAIVVSDGSEGFDARLLDGERLKLEDGELCVRRAPASMRGYFGVPMPEDPWWRTGDLVVVSEGRARFCGRRSELINVGGFKVNPVEVESAIREVRGIEHVVIVPHASSLTGNLVKAIIEPSHGVDGAQLKREVLAYCREKLPSHMQPRMFEFVDRIPMTTTQKQLRRTDGDDV